MIVQNVYTAWPYCTDNEREIKLFIYQLKSSRIDQNDTSRQIIIDHSNLRESEGIQEVTFRGERNVNVINFT